MTETNTIIIGASAAGLASAGCLKKAGIDYKILEQHAHVAHSWRNHYERLHLHTPKSSSGLPYMTMPDSYPKYPSRQQVVDYLESYVKEMGIEPLYDTGVHKISKKGKWIVETNKGSFKSTHVILATGNTNIPNMVDKRGLGSFPGDVIHSSQYKNGQPFKGKNVLVIGFGNSACEIAICLHEHGAHPSMSVRSPVNVIPRDIFGLPVLQLGALSNFLSPSIADKLNKPLIDMLVGDITKWGLRKLPYGPKVQIQKDRQIPLLDIGTMDLIKEGMIRVYQDVQNIEQSTIRFVEGKKADFDAIIMATGYTPGLERWISISEERLNDLKLPIKKREWEGEDNLYLCGFYVSPSGMLREIGIEARWIAHHIKG